MCVICKHSKGFQPICLSKDNKFFITGDHFYQTHDQNYQVIMWKL